MANLFIETVSMNATNGYRITDPEFVETRFDDKGELYRSLVKEYGKCVSKQYIDGSDGKPVQIGWVFAKREWYSDVRQGCSMKGFDKAVRDKYTFIMETWISVHTEKPTVTTTNHFAKF